MINQPFDLFTLAHGSVGFLFGKIKLDRWLCYSLSIGWEIYQLYFHYKPQGFEVKDVWLDSVIDILAYVFCYEVATRYFM